MRTVHIYEAIQRKKENPGMVGERCIREVCWDGDELRSIVRLKAKTSNEPGTWRIYRTVNRRDVRKAQIELAKTLIDIVAGINDTTKTVETLWKNVLSQPRNKSERLFLIDVDDASLANKVVQIIRAVAKAIIIDESATPNGYHIVTTPFDPRLLLDNLTKEEAVNVEIKKDALFFIEKYEVL